MIFTGGHPFIFFQSPYRLLGGIKVLLRLSIARRSFDPMNIREEYYVDYYYYLHFFFECIYKFAEGQDRIADQLRKIDDMLNELGRRSRDSSYE